MEVASECLLWSKADMATTQHNVRFTPKTGHRNSLAGCLLCAKSRHSTCRCKWKRALEHRVVVGRFFRDWLDDIPMFDDLAVFQLVNIHDGITARARRLHAVDMVDDVVAVGEDADDVAVCVRKLVAQGRDISLEPVWPVGGIGIVLHIPWSEEFRGGVEVLLVDGKLVEFRHRLLVGFHLLGAGGVSRRGEGDECGDAESAKHGEPPRDDSAAITTGFCNGRNGLSEPQSSPFWLRRDVAAPRINVRF